MKHNAPFLLGCFLWGITGIVQADWTQQTAVNCLFWEINSQVQSVLSALNGEKKKNHRNYIWKNGIGHISQILEEKSSLFQKEITAIFVL